ESSSGMPVPSSVMIADKRYVIRCLHSYEIFFFFFKQKTAYEIGLGIPAEPLFRSNILCRISGMALLILALLQRIFLMSSLMLLLVWLIFFRSEERRVGKECRSRRSPYY